MSSTPLLGLLILVVVGSTSARRLLDDPTGFDQNYYITYGGNHVSYIEQGREIQLSMDNSSGSGFGSKLGYLSGIFHLRIKVPAKDSAGVVTAFYLSTASYSSIHDELDFEFLGNRDGQPITLQTNVFANGHGDREQRFHLWFDPTADFHNYTILWNTYQVVFFVDKLPIRIFENKADIGVDYPSQPMQILASVWNGEDWATDGGKAKIDWTQAPFEAHFQGFNIDGCTSDSSSTHSCSSPNLWWNVGRYRNLTTAQKKAYEKIREKYMNYDYCTDKNRHPIPPPECP